MNKQLLLPDKEKIEEKLQRLSTSKDKLNYLYGLKKELANIIYGYSNTVLRNYTKENNNLEFSKASELAKFIEDLKEVKEIEKREELNSLISGLYEDVEKYFQNTTYYKEYYSKDIFDFSGRIEEVDDDLLFGIYDIREKIESELKKYKLCENFVINEIEFLEKQKSKTVNERNDDYLAEENPEEIKQRDKIREYLLEHHQDINSNFLLNLNRIAFEITDFYYPQLAKSKRTKKKEAIRQELLLFRSGEIPLK